jgi:hypothetical protein
MSTTVQLTPSKKVRCHDRDAALVSRDAYILMRMQAASAIESLNMSDSPAKKLSFTSENKENVFKPIVGIPDLDDVKEDEVAQTNVAPTIKPEEAHEPLLQENAQRFVLFPIKYHDVSRRVTSDYASRDIAC